MEKKIEIDSDGNKLEGLLALNSPAKAVVVTHPHPLYGGEMHNPVVSTISSSYYEQDYTTLRFNFRGAGYSQGKHDDGDGEQRDVLAAVSYLQKSGFKNITLAGYSFGAWVNLMVAAKSTDIESLILVSPPVDFIAFETVRNVSSLKLVVAGTRDEYAAIAHVSELLGVWNADADLEEIEGGDHFYSGSLGQLKEIILSYS